MSRRKCEDPNDKNKKEVILYCGPSNKSVDVVAEYLMKFKGNLQILRVYGLKVEMVEYPYPNSNLQFSQRSLRQDRSKPELSFYCRFKKQLFIAPTDSCTSQSDIKATDTPSPSRPSEVKSSLLYLYSDGTKTGSAKIVLIGDHKQLQPIVKNQTVKKLGMGRSLFERYYTMFHENTAVMLDTQYRMHEDICKFPSEEFYDNKLKTGVPQPSSVLRVDGRTMPLVFGHIEGETIHLVVKTAKGNNNSKANQKEREKVV
ncbi:hypothetical protein XENOCAPTIV_013252, partial [Xenoophorus captivus]